MLKVVNLTKVYKSKEGVDVRALDGVTIQFPEKGMVFLLGKSGSGKSTLLNVCGGLDSPTEGEVIVKGRSSKDFSQSDFDSYRNTFVGFIFQEYNILNEFTVEDNIALALELQGKSKDAATIAALLEEVDLAGFAKRKPNTLSGGQKQRIAIARALVKAPEIIMADEPTGALDSKTGKQVFETLKKLSADKLVIVVSHDRDFAEQYADRIIELKDGKVLSDVTKTEDAGKALSSNVEALGEVLCVQGGATLSDADFDEIKAFLKRSKGDIVIAADPKNIGAVKKAVHINDAGEKEFFLPTDAGGMSERTYTSEDGRFIRSKLPLRHAIKIGLAGLKSKPFRLFLTVLLCTVAFTLFGLLSTMSFYDSESVFRETMQTGNSTVMKAEKDYLSEVAWYYNGEKSSTYEQKNSTYFTDTEFAALKSQYGDQVFGGVNTNYSISLRNTVSPYWKNTITTVAYLSEGNSLRQQITGAYPQNEGEIVLPSYIVDVMVQGKVNDAKGEPLNLSAPADLIGRSIKLGDTEYKVTGIFDCGALPEKFDLLKDDTAASERLEMDLKTTLSDGLYCTAFVCESQLKIVAAENHPYVEDGLQYRNISVALSGKELPERSNANYMAYSTFAADDSYMALSGNNTSLAEDEAIISDGLLASLVMDYCYAQLEQTEWTGPLVDLAEMSSELNINGTHDDEGNFVEFTTAKREQAYASFIKELKAQNIPLTINLKLYDQVEGVLFGEDHTLKVIGVYQSNDSNGGYGCVYLNDMTQSSYWAEQKISLQDYSEVSTNYVEDPNAKYTTAFLPYDHSEEHTDLYWALYENEDRSEDSSRIYLSGSFVETLRMIDETVHSMSQIFLYIGLVMALFSILLFSNFISVSISQKKRDIGILRAVGARSNDVFKIFFSESFFISIICIVLSIAGCAILCNVINVQLAAGIGASLMVFGPLSLIVLVAIALLTAVLATFLPVNNAARKKPVESIRSF